MPRSPSFQETLCDEASQRPAYSTFAPTPREQCRSNLNVKSNEICMARKAYRLFQIVNLLRIHQPIAASELATRLGVSTRTIYRYVDDLSLSGIPIYGEPGVGYAIHKNFELPPLALNANELEILILSLDMLSTSVGGKALTTAQALLAKIDAAAPLDSRITLERKIFSMVTTPQATQSGCWEALRIAIRLAPAVQTTYLSLQNETTTREVYPLGLFYWGGKWTMGAWCCARNEYRDFRVDRIIDVQAVNGSVGRNGQVSLADYMGHQALAWREKISKPTDTTLSVVTT